MKRVEGCLKLFEDYASAIKKLSPSEPKSNE